jgi:hypothetical protein
MKKEILISPLDKEFSNFSFPNSGTPPAHLALAAFKR